MLDTLEIEKIRLPLPFRLNHVNCFLAKGEDGYTVMDTGLNQPKTADMWQEVLAGKTVNKLLITHLHPDHCGYAGQLQRETGATAWMTKTDADALELIWQEESLAILTKEYERAGMPKSIVSEIIRLRGNLPPAVTPLPKVTHHIQEGESVKLGKGNFEVIFTPGHSDGLICLFDREKSVLLSTDHILPRITPNISYWFYGEENPLQLFQDSLEKVRNLQAGYVIPSHGEPFEDANARIDAIWDHHEERLAFVLDRVKSTKTAFAMCREMFPRDLSDYDYQFAIGETIAHLEYLRAKGMLSRELYQGKWAYMLT